MDAYELLNQKITMPSIYLVTTHRYPLVTWVLMAAVETWHPSTSHKTDTWPTYRAFRKINTSLNDKVDFQTTRLVT